MSTPSAVRLRRSRRSSRPPAIVTAAAALLALGLAACGGEDSGAGAGGTYKIGIFAPTTGFAASDGKSAVNSAKLAVEKVNAAGGVQGKELKLVVYDDASKPDQAATIAQKLVRQDNVDIAVSGSYSAQTRAAAPIFARSNKVMIAAYAVDPEITQVGEQIWRIGELASVQGKVAGKLVLDNLKGKKVAILYVDNDFGTGLTKAFRDYVKQNGGQIVSDSKYPLEEKDFRTVLGGIKAKSPDVLYAPGYYNNAADMANQAAELGLKAQIVGVEGYDSPKLIDLAGKNAEGIIFTTELDRDSSNPAVKDFLSGYEKKTGVKADAVGAETYDAVLLGAEALKHAGGADAKKLVEGLKKVKALEGSVTGITGFSPQRNGIREGLAQVVKGGDFHRYATFRDPSLITPP